MSAVPTTPTGAPVDSKAVRELKAAIIRSEQTIASIQKTRETQRRKGIVPAKKQRDQLNSIINAAQRSLIDLPKRIATLQSFEAAAAKNQAAETKRVADALQSLTDQGKNFGQIGVLPRSVQTLAKPLDKQIRQLRLNQRVQGDPIRSFEITKQINSLTIARANLLASANDRFQGAFETERQFKLATARKQAQSAGIKEAEARALGTVVGTAQEGTPVLIGSQFAEAEKLKAAGVETVLNEQGGRDLSLNLEETLTISDKPLGTDLIKGLEGGGRGISVDLAENLGFRDDKAAPQTIKVKIEEKAPEPIPEEDIAKRDFQLDLASGQLTTKITTKPQVAAAKQQVAEQQAFGDLLLSGKAIIPNIDSLVSGQALLLPEPQKKEKTTIVQEGIIKKVDQPPKPTADQQLTQLITNIGKQSKKSSDLSTGIFTDLTANLAKQGEKQSRQLFGGRRLGGESLIGGKAIENNLDNITKFLRGTGLFVKGGGLGLAEEGLATFAFGVNIERQGAPIFKQLVTGGKLDTKKVSLGGTGRFETFINVPTGRITGGQKTFGQVAQIKIPETAPTAAIGEIASQSTVDIGTGIGGGIFQSGQGLRSFLETGDSSKLLAGVGSFKQAGAGLGTLGGSIGAIAQEQGIARSIGQAAFLVLPVTPKGFRQLVPLAISRFPITTGAVKLVTKTARKGGIEIKAFGKTLGGGGKIITKTVTEPEVLKGARTLVFGLGGKRSIGIGGRSATKGILDVETRSPITSQISKALEPIPKPKRSFFIGSPTRKIENLGLQELNTIDRGLEPLGLRGFERKLLTSKKATDELVRLEKIRTKDPELLATLTDIANFVKKSPEGRQLKAIPDPEIRAPLQSLRKGKESKGFLGLLPELPKSKGGFGQNLTTLTERLTSDLDTDFGGLFRGERRAQTTAQKGEKIIKDASILEGNIKLTKDELKSLSKEIGSDSQLFQQAAKQGLPRGAIKQGTKVFTGFKIGETLKVPKVSLKRDEFLHGTTVAIAKRIKSSGIDLQMTQRGLFFGAKEPRLPSGFTKKAVDIAKRKGLTGEEIQPALTKLVLKDGIGFRGLDKFTKKKLQSQDFITFQDNVVENARKQGFKFAIKPYKALESVGKKLEAIVFDEKALKRTEKIIPLTTQDRLTGKAKFLENLTDKDAIGDAAKTSPPLDEGKRVLGIKSRKPTLITSPFLARQLKTPFKLGLNPIKKTFGRRAVEVNSVQDQTLNKIASVSAIQSQFTEGAELIGREAAKGLRRDRPLSQQGRIGAPSFRQFKDVADLTGKGANIDTLAFLFEERGKKRGAKLLGKRDITAAAKLRQLKQDLIRLTPEVDLEEFALKNKLPKGQTSIFKDPAAAKAAEGFASTKAKPNTIAGAKLKKQSESLNRIIDNQINIRPPSIPSGVKKFDITESGSLAAKNSEKAISLLGKIEAPSGFSPPKSKPDSFVSKTIDNLTSFSKSPFDNSMSSRLNSITKISTPSSLPSFAKASIPLKPSPKGSLGKISKPSVNLNSLPSFPSIRSPSRPSPLSPPSPTSPPRASPPSPPSPPRNSPPRPAGSTPSSPLGRFNILPPAKVIAPKRLGLILGRVKEQKRRRRLPSFTESLTFIADPPDPERAGVLLPKGVTQLVSGKSDIFKQIDKNLAKARKKAGSFVPLGESTIRSSGRQTTRRKTTKRKSSKKKRR